MPPAISFWSGQNQVQNMGGSGLGFFGAGWAQSINVGAYQDTTFMTDGAGSIQGPQVANNKWTAHASGAINGAASVELTKIPNYLATVNIRFTNDTAVKVQNNRLRIYDRSDITKAPSGVTTKVYEVIHPDTTQNNNGSGISTWWTQPGLGTASGFVLMDSPGISGHYNNRTSTRPDTVHDFYCAISASPDSVGSKSQYSLYFSTEFL